MEIDEYTGIEAQNDIEFMNESLCEDECTEEEIKAKREALDKYFELN